jgi:hypothetical protein
MDFTPNGKDDELSPLHYKDRHLSPLGIVEDYHT